MIYPILEMGLGPVSVELQKRVPIEVWSGYRCSVKIYKISKCPLIDRVRKLLNLRIFQDPDTKKQWEKSVVDLGLEILCVSQVMQLN